MEIECTNCLLSGELENFIDFHGKYYCKQCYNLLNKPIEFDVVEKNFNDFVSEIKEKQKNCEYDVLFALSGGKDSIAALYYTVEKYKLRPLVFTIDHGFKNDTIMNNCRKIVEKYDLDWTVVKVKKSITSALYNVIEQGELPCYQCGKLWKGPYISKMVKMTGIEYLFIGGDTLSPGSAIIEREDYNCKKVGLPLPLNIKSEKEIYDLVYSLGWEDPNIDGWDTDCIAVGYALKKYRDKNEHCHTEEINHLSEKIRFGLFDKETAKTMLKKEMQVSEENLKLINKNNS